jgi:DNA helicase IV
VIVDWRAPVANLYYEGRLGKASYACPAGAIAGDLSLKRQFVITAGNLQEIQDIDITTNDEFLQASLGANADNRLKEIVSTIQAISEVLPELGVERVKQTTFENFAMEAIGAQYKIGDANEKLLTFLDSRPTGEDDKRHRMLRGHPSSSPRWLLRT